MTATHSDPLTRRNPWLVVVLGLFALVCVLMIGVGGYWRYANELPAYPPPNVVMPVPNAYDDYVRAGLLCRTAGGAAVTPPPTGANRYPGPSAVMGRQKQAYEPDMPLPQVRAVLARNRPALNLL